VSDLLSLGNATIEETLALLRWLRAAGHGPLGVCGFSMCSPLYNDYIVI
jgi:hypothetical protein